VIRSLRAQHKSILQTMEKLERDRQRVEAGLIALRDGSIKPPVGTRRRRRLSKAARRKISAAQKARWAKAKKAAS
jgi:hypothetical protein